LFLLQGGCAFTRPHFLFLQGPTNKNKNGLGKVIRPQENSIPNLDELGHNNPKLLTLVVA
jgi:hypothetical protein